MKKSKCKRVSAVGCLLFFGRKIKNIHVHNYLYKKKHRKDKPEVNRIGYPQGLVGNELERIAGIGEGWKSSGYTFCVFKFYTLDNSKERKINKINKDEGKTLI